LKTLRGLTIVVVLFAGGDRFREDVDCDQADF